MWHPAYLDFATFYGFTPFAHWPYRPQTKGKTESGVKYVQRNALAGKRFRSWAHLNEWLLEWATTVADTRVHGTTHEPPRERFAREQLSPLGARRVYARERVQHRRVASDSLVAIGGSRYSVPARYVGELVVVRELLGRYEILHQGDVIARHQAMGRRQVIMEPAHYVGLLRPRGVAPAAGPPRFDPSYPATADVADTDRTRGREAADQLHSGSGWMAGGFVSGILLGLIGTGISWVMASSSSVEVNRAPDGVEASCYRDGYTSKAKSKNSSNALTGGLLGTAVLVVLIVSASSGSTY